MINRSLHRLLQELEHLNRRSLFLKDTADALCRRPVVPQDDGRPGAGIPERGDAVPEDRGAAVGPRHAA